MAGPIALPEGYVLDNQPGLPQGYVMDSAKGNSSADDYYNHVQAQKASGQGFWGGLGQDLTDKAQALQTGLTQLPLGALQAGEELLARGARAVGAPQTAQGSTNAANAIGQVAAEQLAKSQNAIRNNPTNEAFQIIPQALQLGGAGTSLPAILGAGATAGALSPKMTPQDLQNANYQPANTMFDKSMNALSYLPSQAVDAASAGLGTDPNARLASAVKGALTAGEGYGIAKAFPKALDAISNDTPPVQTQSTSALKDLASQAYDVADSQGGNLHPNAVNKAIDEASQIAPQTEGGRAFAGDNATTKAVNDLSQFRDKPMSLATFQEVDRELGSRIEDNTDALGSVNAQGRNLIKIRQTLNDAVKNAAPEDLQNPQAFEAYKNGQKLYETAMRSRDIDRIYEKAASADVPQTVIKNGFAKLVKEGQGSFTNDEWAAVQNAARTGLLTGALKVAGSKLISGIVGSSAGAAGGGVPGALVGAAAAETLAYPLRKVAEAMQTAKGNKVQNLLSQRPVVQNALNPQAVSNPASGIGARNVQNLLSQAALQAAFQKRKNSTK